MTLFQTDVERVERVIETVTYTARDLAHAKALAWQYGVPVCDPEELDDDGQPRD